MIAVTILMLRNSTQRILTSGTVSIMNDKARVAHLTRLVLEVFILTFATSRILVLLIMTHRMPDLYLHVGGTHVHHLNYGIFMLSGVGALLLFARPTGLFEDFCAVLYAIGLGLTFDEFGMWLHLGGPYWQRASFDAVIIISAFLGLLVALTRASKPGLKHTIMLALIIFSLAVLGVLTTNYILSGERVKDRLEKIESESPA